MGRTRVIVLSRGDQELLQVSPVGILENHVVRFLLAAQTDQFHDVLVVQLVEKIQVTLKLLESRLVLRIDQTLHHDQRLFITVNLILGRVDLAEFTATQWFQFLQIGTRRGDLVVIRLGFLRLVAALTLSGIRAVAFVVGIAILLFPTGRVHLAVAGLF